jgi:hypothetical protein
MIAISITSDFSIPKLAVGDKKGAPDWRFLSKFFTFVDQPVSHFNNNSRSSELTRSCEYYHKLAHELNSNAQSQSPPVPKAN